MTYDAVRKTALQGRLTPWLNAETVSTAAKAQMLCVM